MSSDQKRNPPQGGEDWRLQQQLQQKRQDQQHPKPPLGPGTGPSQPPVPDWSKQPGSRSTLLSSELSSLWSSPLQPSNRSQTSKDISPTWMRQPQQQQQASSPTTLMNPLFGDYSEYQQVSRTTPTASSLSIPSYLHQQQPPQVYERDEYTWQHAGGSQQQSTLLPPSSFQYQQHSSPPQVRVSSLPSPEPFKAYRNRSYSDGQEYEAVTSQREQQYMTQQHQQSLISQQPAPRPSFANVSTARTTNDTLITSRPSGGSVGSASSSSLNWSQRAAFSSAPPAVAPSVPSERRASYLPSPGRFISRQLKQGSRTEVHTSESSSSFLKQPVGSKPALTSTDPIGIFFWGFGDQIKVKDVIQEFSCYGDMKNVGLDSKNGIPYAFIDFNALTAVQEAFVNIPKHHYFGMNDYLQVRLRFDKVSPPSFDQPSHSFAKAPSVPVLEDKKTIHLFNLPHNINKPEIETVLLQIAPSTQATRIKIFQRAAEKKSSVFISFKTEQKARQAAIFMKQNNLIFKEMNEPMEVEWPTQDITFQPPVFSSDPNAVPALSKKARKLLAASNCIAYARSPEALDPVELKAALSIHGPCKVFIIKAGAPSTAFIRFETPKACSEALQAKTCGVTLPRHKRVDIPRFFEEESLRKYLAGVGDIKAISRGGGEEAPEITTVEFLTALGAAQGILRFETVPFEGVIWHADYSPSMKIEGTETDSESKGSLSVADNTSERGFPEDEDEDSLLDSIPLPGIAPLEIGLGEVKEMEEEIVKLVLLENQQQSSSSSTVIRIVEQETLTSISKEFSEEVASISTSPPLPPSPDHPSILSTVPLPPSQPNEEDEA